MTDPQPSSATRISLLFRLRQEPASQAAWNEFAARYGPQIGAWCRRWGLQEADAEDVTQSVLTLLSAKLRDFSYDPKRRFRAWLKTVTRHAWSDFIEARRRQVGGSGDSAVLEALNSAPARADLETRLQEAFDLELLDMAMARVRKRVAENTWSAFQLTAVDGLSGADAAAQLGMAVGLVFKARSNVQKLLREEIRQLEKLDTP
jgi:RNA polymerase sigma-70 factor (ECF subfamily)